MDFHDKLDVFLHEDKIGTLSTDNGVMSFAYDADYLNTPGAYPDAHFSNEQFAVYPLAYF